MTTFTRPYVLDPSGSNVQREAALLRERGPVTRVELPGGVLAWAVIGYEEAKRVLTDPRVSKDAYRHWPAWITGEVPRDWSLAMWIAVRSMFTAYGDDHTRLRRLVSKAFTPKGIASLRPRAEELCEDLLDQLAGKADGGVIDFREHFAVLLPIQVLCELLGVPDNLRYNPLEFIDTIFRTSSSNEEAQESERALYAVMTELIETKRRSPQEDLTSALIAVRDDDGHGLNEQEMIDTLLSIISAGYETTVNLLCNVVHALLMHPDQLDLVRSGGATWEDAVDETLRAESPANLLPLRYAVEDIEVGGVTIAKGDAIIMGFGPAGRDPVMHGPTAAEFDVTRPTRREHLGFGFGVHYCIGAPLARLEVGVALPALFNRFPNLSFAGPPEQVRPQESFVMNALDELPVRLG